MSTFALSQVMRRSLTPRSRHGENEISARLWPGRPFVPSLTSEWVGTIGEHVRVPVEVVGVSDEGHRIKRYLVRQIGSENLLEWSSALRYGFRIGERLQLSGLVQAHVRRDGVCVTTLHECFNPLRMT